MAPSRSKRRRRGRPPRRRVQVPTWYYGLLVVIAVVGLSLIYAAWRSVPVSLENDYILGSPDAPVTMIDWGAFQ